jgi:hypothetical protein
MPNDKVVQETRRWFNIVWKDPQRARKDLDRPPVDPEGALFHCQQAIEKAMAWEFASVILSRSQEEARVKPQSP